MVGIDSSHTAGRSQHQGTLKRLGIHMKRLSIVGKDYHPEEDVVGDYNTGDRVKVGASLEPSGAACGACCSGRRCSSSRASGLSLVRPAVTWIVAGPEGAAVVGGLSAMGAVLYGIGIPKDSVMQYADVSHV